MGCTGVSLVPSPPTQLCTPPYRNWAMSRQSSILGLLVRSSSLVWATFRKADFSLMAFLMDSMVFSVWKISCRVCDKEKQLPKGLCESLGNLLLASCLATRLTSGRRRKQFTKNHISSYPFPQRICSVVLDLAWMCSRELTVCFSSQV